ncbi:DUF4435 domain-containing protein [Nocardiopsis dassonvillei]|uniref:DUF4435 domain-containing protein n=1 Tax=Nocardiopsis dassonvillei TaxID=2014 RepID=UPI0008FCB317|nr:DUF4435 domain-containing protein [Nocardiopsis dassonvillei]
MTSKSPSLRSHDRVAQRIRSHSGATNKPFLVVEGKADRNLIIDASNKAWEVFIAGTRNKVYDVVVEAKSVGVKVIAGLIDRDFDDYYDSISVTGVPIFTYPEADLESVLINGDPFDRLIREYASEEKLEKAGGVEEVRESCKSTARMLGVFRRYNFQYGWGVNFENINFSRKIDKSDLVVPLEHLENLVRGGLECRDHHGQLDSVILQFQDLHQSSLFRGKDALEVVKVALQKKIASHNIQDASFLASALRLSASRDFMNNETMVAISLFFSETKSSSKLDS